MTAPQEKRSKRKVRKPLTPEQRAHRERVRKIADIIGETGAPAYGQIGRILNRRGLEFVKARLRETLQVHKDGGMLTDDGSRQRTTGGIFFHLCKRHWLDGVQDIEDDLVELDSEPQAART